MKRSIARLCILFVAFALLGCKQEDPNPELLDPIYVDLDKRYKDSQKGLEDEIKKRDDTRTALAKAEPNTIELKNAEKDLDKSNRRVTEFEERTLYYKIRSQRRYFEDRINYKVAYSKNEVWPDSHEYSDYQVNIRLQEASRNWGARVPKLQDRLTSASKAKEKPAKSEE